MFIPLSLCSFFILIIRPINIGGVTFINEYYHSLFQSQPRLLLKVDDDLFLNPSPLEEVVRKVANVDNFMLGTVYAGKK